MKIHWNKMWHSVLSPNMKHYISNPKCWSRAPHLNCNLHSPNTWCGLCVSGKHMWIWWTVITCWPTTGILTSESPVYSGDSPVQQRAASLLNPSGHCYSDPALSGVRGLTPELRPEKHSLPLWLDSLTACKESNHIKITLIFFGGENSESICFFYVQIYQCPEIYSSMDVSLLEMTHFPSIACR